jgi:glycerol-3-phosphate acyltransferase PlsY
MSNITQTFISNNLIGIILGAITLDHSIILLALIPTAYLIGRIPFSVYVARMKGIDLLNEGSKNPGASNVIRLAGWKYGILAILLDAFKGFAPALIAQYIFDFNHIYAIVVLICATLGHSFPITRKGGKGVATTAGGMIAIYPVLTLIIAITWFAIMKIKRLPAVASLTCGAIFVIVVMFIENSWSVKVLILLSYCLLAFRHLPNILRLFRGNENQA